MSRAFQPALFAPSDSRPRRTELDPTSWVELASGWLASAAELFSELLESAAWRQRERRMYEKWLLEPRLTAELHDVGAAPPALRAAADALSSHYLVRYDSLWLNLYRDGRDSTAWHGDRISCKKPECIVPVLTLGATRRFLLKPRTGGKSLVFAPVSGDVLVMGGRCQRDWVHAVPKEPEVAGARISVNFQSSEQGRRTRA